MLLYRKFHFQTFFRQASRDLSIRYFEKHLLILADADEDVPAIDLFETYAQTNPDIRQKAFKELGMVFDLGLSRAMPYLIKKATELEIDYHNRTPLDLAFLVFLKKPDEFYITHELFHLEQIKGYQDFRGNKKNIEPKPFNSIKAALINELKQKFQEQERGQMVIEHYPETGRIAYKIYYEDYNRPKPKIEQGTVVYKNERPIYEVISIYYPSGGRLKIKARTDRIRDTWLDAFAGIVIGDAGFFNHPDAKKVYDLTKFKDLPLQYPTSPVHNIENVREVGIRMSYSNSGDTIELHSENNLRNLITRHNINLHQVEITKIEIRIKFVGSGHTKTIWLSKSNHSNIGDSDIDQIIDDYLREWEIANR